MVGERWKRRELLTDDKGEAAVGVVSREEKG